ncbi:MAG: hypothetical protein K1X88_15255 [Nannocystaceae bacterium]|nr:hypothetical protein [Nannocystaceae bacterium]
MSTARALRWLRRAASIGVGALMAACHAPATHAPPPLQQAPPPATALPSGLARVAAAPLRDGALWLARDAGGTGSLWLARGGAVLPVRCEPLPGAWGLLLDDVDGDGRLDAIVALHKPAKFDPVPANRLHVYGFDGDRCAPLWRGTRLAGRFDAFGSTEARGTLLVHEWLSPTRHRLARYRWQDFGFVVTQVDWSGEGELPGDHAQALQRLIHGPAGNLRESS